MADRGVFDLILFGYRNDLARARTLAFLDQLMPSQSGPTCLEPAASLPHRLFAALDRERADQLCAQLEALGAQVTLLQAGVPSTTPVAMIAAPVNEGRGIRPLTLVLVILLGATASLWRFSTTVHIHAPTHPRPRSSVAQLQSMVSRSEMTNEPAAVHLNAEAIALAGAGRFREAVERLQSALRLAPEHPVLTHNLQSVLLDWGVTDLAADKLDGAADHLQRAARLGERIEVLRALGATYVRQADLPDAAPLLERALQIEPHDTATMVGLADVYLKLEKRPQALDLLQRAKEAGVTGPELDKKMQQLSREVDVEWGYASLDSPHFRVSFADDGDRSTVRLVLDALEEAYDVVGAKFDSYPEGRTTAVLYTQRDFHTVTQTPHWAGGAFDGRIKFPVRGLTPDNPNLPRVVRHEYTHSLIALMTGGRCPVWLNEGLAVWAEEDRDGDHEAWAESHVANQQLFSLDELSRSFVNLPANRVEVAYAESYLAVRSLIDSYGVRTMPSLLKALSRTNSVNDAFAAVYQGDLSGFQEQLLHQLHE
jgi:tetratricopeptide (TPR) repeat protein